MEERRLEADLIPKIKKLDISTRRLVLSWMVGRYRSTFRGKGLEFDSYRDYSEADDASRIDWKASVRANKLLIKQYVEERNINIFFLLDVSSSMIFSSTEKLKCEYAAELISTLSYVALEVGDAVGLNLFTDKLVKRVPPAMGGRQMYAISKTLVDPFLYGGNYDLGKALGLMVKSARRNSLLIIITDFIGLKAGWEKDLKLVARKFDTIGVMIKDPRDRFMPDTNVGQVVISDPYSDRVLLIDPLEVKGEYERYVREQEEEIRRIFLNEKSDFMELSTDQPFIEPLVEFFKSRIKRWR
jgi:uncharacterized protein (DUF58 family)